MTNLMIEAALRALGLAAVVGLGLTVLRVRHVPARKAAWRLVLIASTAMPLLMRWPAGFAQRFAWVVPVPQVERAAPQKNATAVPAMLTASHALKLGGDGAAAPWRPAKRMTIAAPVVDRAEDPFAGGAAKSLRWPPLATLAVWVYLAVGGALLLRLVYGLLGALYLWVTAERVSPLIAPEGFVRASRRIASPVAIGSGVVLPADYRQWTPRKRRMVLAHEQSHVRQLDFYLQLLAGLYTAVFWFSPLGWLLRRSLASLGEQMADRAGMEAGQSRTGYAELVLEFAAMPRRNLQGVAMARPGSLTHRMEPMLSERAFQRAFVEGRGRGLAALALIPVVVFAVTALVRVPVASAKTECKGETAPACLLASGDARAMIPVTSVAPRGRLALVTAEPLMARLERAQELVPVANVAPAATPQAAAVPAMPMQRQEGGASTRGAANGDDSWAVLNGPEGEGSYQFSGNWDAGTREQMEAARRMAHGPALWFRHGGKAYIVDDPAVVAQIEKLNAPMKELGAKQEALGEQQKELGEKMRALAEQEQFSVKARLPDLSQEMAGLHASLAKLKINEATLNTEALAKLEADIKAKQGQLISPEQIAGIQETVARVQSEAFAKKMAELQANLAQMQGRLGELEGEMGSRRGEFGEKMGALGAQQGKLGAEQGHLGAEQGRLAMQAEREVRRMIEEALRNGQAKPVQ